MIHLNTMDTNHSHQKQSTYRQLKRKKEYHQIKQIANRLEQKDFEKHNPEFIGWEIKGGWLQTGWFKKTYFADLWYLFDLLEWARMKRHTL